MKWIVGIDEVGRGALAGPVTVAAVAMAVDRHGHPLHPPFRTLRDSKKLSPAQREAWSRDLRGHRHVRFAIARVYPRGIERLNISAAANRAAERALLRLVRTHRILQKTPIFLDGGLFIGNKKRQRSSYIMAVTAPKADERIPAVAAASIIAKVSRDRYMATLARRHPGYGFEIHKGYGTARHRQALQTNGPCPAHRLTFVAPGSIINR